MFRWLNAQSTSAVGLCAGLAVFASLCGLDTHGSFAGSGDEPHYAMIAQSLVFDRDLDMANDYRDANSLVGASGLRPESHAVPGRNGTLRPVHDIGLPLLSAPYFVLAYGIAASSPVWLPPGLMSRARLNPPLILRHLLSLFVIAMAAVMAYNMFHAFRMGARANAPPFVWTLIFALSPPLLSHEFLFFTEIPTALLTLLLYRELVRPIQHSTLQSASIGAASGLLLLLHIRNVGLAAALIVLYLWSLREDRVPVRHAIFFLLPLAAICAIRTALNVHMWGHLLSSPHVKTAQFAGARAIVVETAVRIFGLLFDQEHGLLPYAPVYLLALPGMAILRRRDRRAFVVTSGLVVGYLLPVLLPFANPYGWDGGWSPAARFLVPITPLLALWAYSYALQLGRWSLPVVMLMSVQIALDLLLWSRPRLLWNASTGRSALVEFLSTHWHANVWLPSWHAPTATSAGVSVVLLAVWIVMSMVSVRSRRDVETLSRTV